MKFRPILLAWLLLLGSTLAMGGGAWWLLDREADRVETLATGAVANGAATVADSVDLLMEEIRTGVTDGLFAARRSPQPRSALSELVANNPYAQTGFYFRGSDGVTSWYGPRGDAPSPTTLQSAEAGQTYPWSVNQDDEQEAAARRNDVPLYLSPIQHAPPSEELPAQAPAPLPQSKSSYAPTDILQKEATEEAAQTPDDDYALNSERQRYASKSEALKTQRASVRQMNMDNRAAVLDQNMALEQYANANANQAANTAFFADTSIPSAPQNEYVITGGLMETEAKSDEMADLSTSSLGGSLSSLTYDYSASQTAKDSQSYLTLPNEKSSTEEAINGLKKKDVGLFLLSNNASTSDSFLDRETLNELSTRIKVILPGRPRTGWVSHEINGRQQWLAWIDLPEQDNILGVWLNRDAVIAEIAKTINISQQKDVQFALVDASGRRVAGAGGEHYSKWESSGPELTLDVGAALPGWRIEAYPALGQNPFGRSFRLLGGLIVAGLSIAILLGGSLLLWQSQRDAQEAQRKTTFVANVSHELKTPLTSIRLFAEMLYDGRAGDETKRRRYLQTMLNETQRLTRLVNNVLDFSRLERGRRDFQQESVDTAQAVSDILEAQRDRLSGEGLTVEYVAPDQPLKAVVDRDALEQILLNLLDNAAKYASSGERAVVSLEQRSDSWSLSVCDFGPGIPHRERQHVFEAFHRIDDRLTSERPGCGLGLSIAARLAEGLGGRLTLKPNQPQGCCFKLIVPLNDSQHA